ncbi:hypothetical protein BAUCODRAFT_148488 [Baudoinia panamericana UAMH 10762]|uniref:MHD domain-containing protein n=1 Tax=Baudoinia panamericana (strain UAMH 10762) TaxID=717646 RepID=M2LMP3_BAUPA|nr:uncharacterized protein BAUCODRAFT_148488 [Baudoinia panamericana UAMH 10762]EMC95592.1 hypothetical protein BAUCODRAFT_148488 [Baudoinia panamericana UAMH 10762]
MERQEYPRMLPQLQPGQAVDVLNDRVRQIDRLNVSLADWLQERRRLEEQYSAGLRRLAQRHINDVDLGIFSVPWATLTGAADTMSDSHSALAAKIEMDVEQPLRNFASSNREMQAMSTMQGNLGAMAKEVDKARQKAEKVQHKGDRAEAGRVANASSDVENAQTQWESQAPYVFENLQALDEARLNHLRDAMTQFQTHEVDLVQKSQSTAEHCLNVLLSLQTEDEIKTFALKAVSGRPRADRSQRASIAQAPPSRAGTSSTNLTPTISQPDDDSLRSGSVQEEKKKSRFGGLKRLGTITGGKKRESKMVPSNLAPTAESPERKPKSSPFNPLGGRFGRNRDNANLEPTVDAASSRERPFSPQRIGSEALDVPRVAAEPVSPSPLDRVREAPQTNGTAATFGGAPQLAIPNGSHQVDLADLEPPKPSQPQPQPIPEMAGDSEGYSLPPQTLDPISQAQAEAAAAGGEQATPTYNVNIRSTPIEDEGHDSAAALAVVANKLQAPPPVLSKTGTVRGRRNRPVSSFGDALQETPVAESSEAASEQSRDIAFPSPQAPAVQSPGVASSSQLLGSMPGGSAAAGTFSPFALGMGGQQPFRPVSAIVEQHTGDTGSIRSGKSLTSTGSQSTRHPELHHPGLNSSIVETVNARFENGKLLTSSLIGEIALAYNPADFTSPFGSETIRLENFSSLEKVAPNPAFITPASGREGEYAVNLSGIAKTQVAFKYQIRADDAGANAPLLVTPAFKIEPNQTSVIISYSLNPGFNLHSRETLTLSNVMLALTLEGAKATTCLSKPVGVFSRERNSIVFQLGEVTLRPGAAPEKLLARFATESEAKGGSVEARWEIAGENAMGLGSGLAVSLQSQAGGGGGAGDGADPFADDEASGGLYQVWKGVPGVRKLTSGAYLAKYVGEQV